MKQLGLHFIGSSWLYFQNDKSIDSLAKFWKIVVDENVVGPCAEIYKEDAILR